MVRYWVDIQESGLGAELHGDRHVRLEEAIEASFGKKPVDGYFANFLSNYSMPIIIDDETTVDVQVRPRYAIVDTAVSIDEVTREVNLAEIATKDEEIRGIVLMQGVSTKEGKEALYVDKFAVTPEYQGNKVGPNMLELSLYLAMLKSDKMLFLRADANNVPANNLYSKVDFDLRQDPCGEWVVYSTQQLKQENGIYVVARQFAIQKKPTLITPE